MKMADLTAIEGRVITLPDFPSKGDARRFIELPVGLAILTLCMLAGEQLRFCLHLIIPANLVGLFVLLLCFSLRVVPPRLIEAAAKQLLYVMPALAEHLRPGATKTNGALSDGQRPSFG